MANSIYEALGGERANQQQQQDPRNAALSRMKAIGLDVPQGMENDPNALLNYILQSGKIPQGRLGMAQQVMQRLMGRR